jgi:hypoxanthine phosphoribosyltransferase
MKVIYEWEDFDKDVEKILDFMKSYDSNDCNIIAISKGGLPLGVTLANKLKASFSIIEYQRYDEDGDSIVRWLKCNVDESKPIYLVDDLVDEGITLDKCSRFIEKDCSKKPYTIVLLGHKNFDVTYSPNEKPDGWVTFPWE